jgi:hypothetical protein
MLDLSSLGLEEIAAALADQTDYEHRWLINPQTGQAVLWTSDTGIDGQTLVDLDDLDLIGIDPLPSYVWYQDMADFAERVSDDEARRRLARAIEGKGAFRRFKDELHQEHPHLLPAWHTFHETAPNAARSTGSSTTRSSTTTQPPGFSTTTLILMCHSYQRCLRPTILTAAGVPIQNPGSGR